MPPSDCKAQEVRILHVLVGENSLVEYVEPPDMLDEFLLSHRKLEGIVSILYVTDMGMVNLIYRYREVILLDYVSDCCHNLLFFLFFTCKDTKNFAYTKIFLVSLTEIFRRAK
jgi:hypothetical protein